MNPSAQTGNYSYPTELMRYSTCPVEDNSGLRNDPRYTQLKTNLFSTNLYDVQQASSVLQMLTFQPQYNRFAGSIFNK